MQRTAPSRTFGDRRDAGSQLADRLSEYRWTNPLVLGLARGGVPVADVVAQRLGGELDVLVARKIGAPGHSEFGIGAVTAEGPPVFDEENLRLLGLTEDDLKESCEAERAEALRRERRYKRGGGTTPSTDREVIVVDDGLATGVTATAALRAVREQGPRLVTFAAPVCSADGSARLHAEADDVICVATPETFMAVGQWYRDFTQTTDEHVINLLEAAHGRTTGE